MAVTSYYVTTDAMGSAASIIDEEGMAIERRSYDAFGEMKLMTPDGTPTETSATKVDVGFQGQVRDDISGLYQMGYRWYNTTLGRWLSRDPIGNRGGVNQQCFANNAPIDLNDKYGLQAQSDPQAAPCPQTNGLSTTELAGGLMGIGNQLERTGLIRDEYAEAALNAKNKAERDALKKIYWEKQTPLGKEITKKILEERQGTIPAESNPVKTNSSVNRMGKMMKYGGRALVVAGVGMEIYEITNTRDEKKADAVTKSAGRIAGAWAGSEAGAVVGASGGPWGVAAGVIIGGILGSIGGEELVGEVFGKKSK
ncbi:MAG: RHS repeat-associated core domain-containing protein [Sphingomonadaceae bacterium]|jgi:RHS repeat-associated protein|nr:RHS repeat-associated core domain-containing protein [Sphingomonadaceae bacterium]NCA02110.1 RHS repeat-associated core domain-containing protein [Sphingomonadaceae bacterium]